MLPEQFHQVQNEFLRLKGEVAIGRLTDDQLADALLNLMVEHEGRYWTIGANTGKWYVNDGSNWVETEPPNVQPAPVQSKTPVTPPVNPLPSTAAAPRKSNSAFSIFGCILLVACCGVLATAAFFVWAASFPQGSFAPSGASSVVTNVTLAPSTDPNTTKPVNPTNEFKQDAVVHAVIYIQDAPKNTQFKATWFAADVGQAMKPNTSRGSVEVISDGSRYIDFTLKPPHPPGSYRVEIAVNGSVQRTASFTVK